MLICDQCGSTGPWFSQDGRLACVNCKTPTEEESVTTTATTKPRKRAPRRTAQPQLDGMQDKKDKALSKVAEDYEELRDEWIATGTAMRAKLAELIKLMEAKGLSVYRDPETTLKVEIEVADPKKKAKVTREDNEE